jgi:hypothetical protein
MNNVKMITDYEVMFALRTGLTVMLPKQDAFDVGGHGLRFNCSPDNPHDILIKAAEKFTLLKNMKKEHVEAALERGFIMFYELEGEEVVRCTPCEIAK